MQTKVGADGVKVVAMVELGILHSRVTPSPNPTLTLLGLRIVKTTIACKVKITVHMPPQH